MGSTTCSDTTIVVISSVCCRFDEPRSALTNIGGGTGAVAGTVVVTAADDTTIAVSDKVITGAT